MLIFYGRTEAEMAEILEPYVGPDTRVHGEWPGKEADDANRT